MKFNLVAVGGTFDHLHAGHRKLLQAAKKYGKKVVVGLCRQPMILNKPFPHSIESYTQRRKNLLRFGFKNIIPLTDIYGPAVTDPQINALTCSPLSRSNAEKINLQRRQNNLNPLFLIEVPLVIAGDGRRLSSSRIRQGLIDRQGFDYQSIFKHNLILPQSLRPKLRQPFAGLTTAVIRPLQNLITVGDIATISFTQKNIIPNLAIVDLKTQRRRQFADLAALKIKPGLTAANPPGSIAAAAVKQLFECLNQQHSSLLIDGEEDLLVLPAILLAPLSTTIYYGQPNQAMVKIFVTETAKTKALNLLRGFTSPKSGPKHS